VRAAAGPDSRSPRGTTARRPFATRRIKVPANPGAGQRGYPQPGMGGAGATEPAVGAARRPTRKLD
jgi:hypothetical protein